MTTTAEKILIMQAYTAGKNIECSSKYVPEWSVTPNPSWDWHHVNYRIKEEKTKPTTYYKVVYKLKSHLSIYKTDSFFKDLSDFYTNCAAKPENYDLCYLLPTETISIPSQE